MFGSCLLTVAGVHEASLWRPRFGQPLHERYCGAPPIRVTGAPVRAGAITTMRIAVSYTTLTLPTNKEA